MKRLLATMQTDLRLQLRNGFYIAAAFVVVVFVILLRQLPEASRSLGIPMLIYGNVLINGFLFVAGLVLLEKGEGTLEAQVVTPLRTGEYLASKIITLTLLSLVESALIVLLAIGLDVGWLALLAGVVLLTPLMVLAGFLLVSRYDTLNEFMFPAVGAIAVLSLPLLPAFGLLEGLLNDVWVYVMPVEPSWLLLQAAVAPIESWQLVYGLLAGVLWVAISFLLAQRAFYRFVIMKQGARA
jgi:fluoroquinolone transport system permease protein